jgi:dephospho-CoA kinase
MERDGCTREAAQKRMRAQMPETEKRVRADYILDNNAAPADLIRRWTRSIKNLREPGMRQTPNKTKNKGRRR